MGRGAAFFDLDRTVLGAASGPVLSEALRAAGVAPARGLPGQDLMYRAYGLIGETLPVMALARAAVLAMRGRARDHVRAAAEEAAADLDALVAPWARLLIAEHREAGRLAVLATTTPADLIEPFARRLGFDDVIATRYRAEPTRGTDRYTGRLDGPFVWAGGKLAEVRRWADRHGVDLEESWAYSDSVYDLPLLSAVGHPTAVNADARLAVVAAWRRWPQVHLDAPPGVPEVLGVEPLEVLRSVVRPEMFPYARFDIAGTEHLPASGGALVVANHRSYFDVVALGLTVMRGGRIPRAMAKKELFDAPVIGWMARAFGQIMVDRDRGGGDALGEARRALRAGEVVVVLPQGTIPRGRAFFDPVLQGRTGAARLAAAVGVPVVPIGVWGSEAVWPRSSRLPDVRNVWHPPTVRVRVGPPVAGLGGDDAVTDTARIMDAIAELLPEEARRPYEPTDEELARTLPPS